MILSRRTLLASVLATASAGSFRLMARSQDKGALPRPDPATFQSGDFLWPKKPGAFVPYNAGSINSPSEDREQWQGERNNYVRQFASQRITDPLLRDRLKLLQEMDYREFIAVYAGAQELGIPGVYAGGAVYVGHCGIVEVDGSKQAWVIEALGKLGVIRMKYEDWLSGRSDQVVWLGRLRELESSRREKVAIEARKHIGKPYNFWNFDLNDDSGFYCSKLVWLSIHRALGFAVDGKESSKRLIWFSPKQLLYVPTIDRLHDPGPYAFL